MKKTYWLFLLFTSLIHGQTAAAETGYIVDQLLVGLHQEKDINSPIIKVLSTGTEIEILNREGDFAEIREKEEGKTGWVDASYLMLEKPARLRLIELQEKIKQLESQQNVQATQALQDQNEEQVNKLNKQIDDLKQNLSSEKIKSGELEAKISQLEKKQAQMEANTDENKVANLKKHITELQNQLDAARQEKAEEVASTAGIEPSYVKLFNLLTQKPLLITLGVIAFVSFLFGRRWEDKKIRKRHGGFRI